MIKKIIIKNYRIFEDFTLEFSEGMNIIVGDNDAGKSTLLEAINLALTFRLHGKPIVYDFSPYLFNTQATKQYLNDLAAGSKPTPPEIIIDLYLDESASTALLRGSNNSTQEDCAGVRIRASLDPEFFEEYKAFVADPTSIKLVPAEYYSVEWLGFSGNGITVRSIPAAASLIDASTIRLQNGTDYYLQNIINENLEKNERVELSRSYRSTRESFSDDPSVQAVNVKLAQAGAGITSRQLSLGIDISQRYTWESSLVAHLDDLPFHFVGNGEQNILKILLALSRKAADSHIILVEEPENHLSFSNLNILIDRIDEKCVDKQVIVTTHSSYVLNKLGLDHLILIHKAGGARLTQLPEDTHDYFKKLSGYDTLRLVLARHAILVEGPSDELVVQRAYLDGHGKLPIHDGIDVINVRGLSFKRFLDIAGLLNRKTTIITDNDGKDPEVVRDNYAEGRDAAYVSVFVGLDSSLRTLEPQLLAANDLARLNEVLGTAYTTDTELLDHMAGNKTTAALAIFNSKTAIDMPEYIKNAVA